MFGEARGVDGGRGHDQLQVGPLRQQLFQIAQQEIDVEAAFVRLVDDQGVVLRKPAVILGFRQQDAVGHELDCGGRADRVVEAHLEPHGSAHRHLQFFGHAARYRTCGDAPRLGATNHARGATTSRHAQFRQLRGLAGTGFAGHHHHLVRTDQGDDLLRMRGDRQRGIHSCRRQCRCPPRALGHRRLHCRGECLGQRGVGRFAVPLRPQTQQPAPVAGQRVVDGAAGVAW